MPTQWEVMKKKKEKLNTPSLLCGDDAEAWKGWRLRPLLQSLDSTQLSQQQRLWAVLMAEILSHNWLLDEALRTTLSFWNDKRGLLKARLLDANERLLPVGKWYMQKHSVQQRDIEIRGTCGTNKHKTAIIQNSSVHKSSYCAQSLCKDQQPLCATEELNVRQ